MRIFYALFSLSLLLLVSIAHDVSSIGLVADSISPLQQARMGVPSENVVCSDGLFLVIKPSNGSPACVKKTTIDKLVAVGWKKATAKNNDTGEQWLIITSEKKQFDDPSLIMWRNDTKLQWANFTGTSVNAGYAAYTYTVLDYSYKIESLPVSECRFAFSDVGAYAYFVTFNSWSDPREQNDYILRHEQGHFDIAQIMALEIKHRMTAELKNKEFDCAPISQSNDKTTRMDLEAKKLSGQIYQSLLPTWHDMDTKYDFETIRSTNQTKQIEWNDMIRTMLLNQMRP